MNSLYSNILPGNYLQLSGVYYKGREMRNPGEFDYNKYLNSLGVSGILNIARAKDVKILNDKNDLFKTALFSVRKYIDNVIKSLHNKETAPLLKGLLLADRSEIDYMTKSQFINAGVIHILAVSGLHVGFVAVVFIFLFGRLNIYLRSLLTIAGLIVFMLITGVPPSVFRATLMAVIIIIAFISNRSSNLFNSLALAALIILFLKPEELFNPGFQLSFSAVLGIAILYPSFDKSINKLKLKSKFLKYILLFMGVSLSAQIGTLPFTLIYFGKLSFISLIANLFVIPLSAVIVGLGIVTLMINSLLPFIAVYFAAANDLVCKLLFIIVEYSGNPDLSYISIKHFSIYDAILFYLFLILLFFTLKKMNLKILKYSVIVLVIINYFIIASLDNKELLKKGKLSIITIDVGQGDAILLRFPQGTTALIDAGDAKLNFDNGERIILPLLEYLGIEKIDYAFVTHIDSDHYAGFVSLVKAGIVKKIFKPELDTALVKDVKFERYLAENNIPVEYYRKQKLIIDNAAVYILNNESVLKKNLSSNDKSGVMKIVFGRTSFLFTGDIEKNVEKIYTNTYKSFLEADLLKAAHHGSKTSSTSEFLKYVTPDQSLISAGILNKFNHPSPEILERLENLGSEIYRTDKQGALIFESDGDSIRFIDWKKHF
ncbi:MAG: DNA internalization-related competence protein ComEC/Rec2 [Ignavibacteriales bacterium]|nr:MAG: DNA internalization-related competence protein ComEC/Rec2 [Ignavibacteriales bacterium]